MAKRGIATQIVLLVAAAVLAATAVLFVVTFQGPPPMRAPVSLDEVARVLTGERASLGQGGRVTLAASLPAPSGLSRNAAAEAELAWRLPGQRIALFTDDVQDGPSGGRDELVGDFVAARQQADGRWRVATMPPGPWLTRWHYVTLGAMLATFLVVLLGAMVVARAIARPLREVAAAAQATDDAGAGPHLPGDGPVEVQRMVAAVTAMRARLSEAIDARTAMLLGIAHDMGTPLNRLAFRAQALPEADRAAAQAEIDGLRAMLARVLDYARDGVDAPLAPVDLGEVVARACARAGVEFGGVDRRHSRLREGQVPQAPGWGVGPAREFATLPHCPPPLAFGESTPPASGSGVRTMLTGDALALERLFANLLDNAAVYGGGAEVTMAVAGGMARVAVADRGPGIDPALLPTLFEPFVRGEKSRNRETGGSGLGLAITRRIAERHGGTVTARNREGGGAEFVVVLPVG